MARTYGKPSEYLLKEASDKSMRIVLGGFLAVFALGLAVGGLMHAAEVHYAQISASVVFACIVTALVFFWFRRRALAWEKERQSFRKGARGEAVVADILARLSDSYFVIHNLPTSNGAYGDYDHVVIGPTGIFVIETKDWRGHVTTDGHGELLRNGYPTERPLVRKFVSRVMHLREHVREVTGCEHFFQAVFVFTSALLKAGKGDTGKALCISEEKLFDLIEEAKPAKRIPGTDTRRIAKALHDFAVKNGKAPHQPAATPAPAAV